MAGGWTNETVTEITAPGGVPFEPGYDVIGIGSEIPDEMAALGYNAAIVICNSDWDESATAPKVKYAFMASAVNPGGSTGISFGIAYSDNPSGGVVNVHPIYSLGAEPVSGAEAVSHLWKSVVTGLGLMKLKEVSGGAFLQLFDTAIGESIRLDAIGRVIRMYDSSLVEAVRITGGIHRFQLFDNSGAEAMRLDGAARCIYMPNVTSAPLTPSGGGTIYTQGGALKYIGSSGTVTTIAPA